MKNKSIIITMIISMLFISCATHVHSIGTGSEIGHKVTARQWYLFNGLVPLNTVDTDAMANSVENYEIVTKLGVVDIGISIGLTIVTSVLGAGPLGAYIINSRTVTVIK